MTDFFDQLETQLTHAAHTRAERRRIPLARWIRALPVLAAAGVAVAVVVVALALLHRGPAVDAGHGSVPPGGGPVAVRYFQQAERSERSCGRGARPTALPPTSDGSPGAALRSLLGVLRRPATAADRLPRSLQSGPDARGVYVRYIRLARVSDGISYYVLPAESVRDVSAVPVRCYALILAAVRAELPRIPAKYRGATLAFAERQVGLARRASEQATGPGVCLLLAATNGNAGTCGATADQLEHGGLVAALGRLSGVVPDGVATVTLDYPAVSGKPGRTVTTNVVGNVFATSLRGHGGGTTVPRIVWRSPQGTVIATVPADARDGGSSSFCSGGGMDRSGHRRPAFC